jgi:outer membrane receptor protein involved in Fe transport
MGNVRWAGPVGNEWYAKFLVDHTRSGGFTRSRTQSVEYQGLPLDVVPALVDADATSFDARVDKYFSSGRQLVMEGGFSQSDGGTYLTQGGRLSVVDSKRSWSRVNFDATSWSAQAYLNTRHADQQALFAPVRYLTASVQFKSELQGSRRFAQDRGRAVFGGSYVLEHVDSADGTGAQTLYQSPVTTREPALFGQIDYDLLPQIRAVAALRWDESTLHAAQWSPKVAILYRPVADHSVHVSFKRGFQVGNYTELFLSSPLAAPVDLSAIENAFAPVLGGVSLGFDAVPVNAFGNSDLDVEKIKSVEVGYAGSLGSHARISVDVYRNSMQDFITDLLPGINPAYPNYQAPATLPAEIRLAVEQTVNAAVPGLTNLPNGRPQIVYSNGNAGRVISRGLEADAMFQLLPEWAIDTSYTWFDFTMINPRVGLEPKPNAPRHRATFGATYARAPLAVSFRHRWVDGFEWASGLFVGRVPSYNVSDLNAMYSLTAHWELGTNISNLFDRRHYEMFGGDILRRRALAHLTVTWQ